MIGYYKERVWFFWEEERMQKNGFDKSFKPDPNKLTIVIRYINLSDAGTVYLRRVEMGVLNLGW